MKRPPLIAAFTLLTAAASFLLAAGPQGVVTTVAGVTYEGEVTESDQQVTVRVHGVETVVPREEVAKIDYTSYADRFEAALKALATEDTAGKLELAREAFNRHEYVLAQKATASALDFDPLDRDARQLDTLINTQIQLEGREPTTSPGGSTARFPTTRTGPQRRVRGLNEEQANRVRQVELAAGDSVRIQFRDNVRKRFVDSKPDGNYRAFSTRTDVDQALSIIAEGTPDMVEDVIIRGEPRGIQSFGRRIQSAVIQGCATSSCHGGPDAGGFRLLAGAPDASTTITNFYLLTQYTKEIDNADAKGIFTPNSVSMINRGSAKNSLLYQYCLPRARARQKHPSVRNWDGLFRDDDDRLAKDLVTWMDSDLARLKVPEYGFKFTLAENQPGTHVATTQSGMPESSTEPATAPVERER